ncbi:MAG: glycosyltransferase family 4 protein [Candidatus Eisenbacteria bacterium]|nr:glycosyltransferase family 4 protein [Candidatus Eisenbacteria bacterium]
MKILYVNSDPGVPLYGSKGASVHLRSMAGALARAGHEVRVLSERLGPKPPMAGDGPAFRVGAFPAGHVDALDPESAALRRNGDVREHLVCEALGWQPDFLYERYSLWGRAGVDAARMLGLPLVLEVNAPLVDEATLYRGLRHADDARRLARHVFEHASVALAVSSAVAGHVCSLGASPARVRVMPNAVERGLFESLPPRVAGHGQAAGDTLTLGFCGGLRPWHGVSDLARIFLRVRSTVPAVRLLVVGDGPARAELEQAMAAAGAADALELTGAVGHAEVPAHLARMDVALAPYPPLEPFYFSPLKLFEYQAAGLPVVASRQGDLPEYVRHGETGFLYPPGHVEAASRMVLELHADRAMAARVGAASRAGVLRDHTWDCRAAEVARIVMELASPRRVAS